MAEEKKVTERYELVQIPTQTDIGFRDTEADEETSNVNIPVYWTLAAGRYLVVKEGSAGANCQIYCRGFLQDV